MGTPGGVKVDRGSGSSQSRSVNQSVGIGDDDIANKTSCLRCWGHRGGGAKDMAPGKSAGLAPAPSPTVDAAYRGTSENEFTKPRSLVFRRSPVRLSSVSPGRDRKSTR